MADISFRNVTKTFPNGKAAVKNFDLEIADGEFLVLTGPSGSGKVTVLRMIAGMEPVSGGELRIDGELVETGKIQKRNVGMIFQHFTLYPGMTVYDNMAFAMKLCQTPEEEIRRAVEETAKLFRIEKLLSCYPRELTELQKQYVAMARAQVHHPEAFLLLDLLGNLEFSARAKARNRLKELYKELGTTLIYVTDNAQEAVCMGARTVVMHHGQIEQAGTVEELLESPCNLFVAQFMNEPGFYTSEVKIVKGHTAVEALGDKFSLDVPAEWLPKLERAGCIGRKVLMGYTVTSRNVPEDGDMPEEMIPEPDSKVFFFDKETEKVIV
ncbi:ABC transporter ATP-binding protein [Lacrimispora sp. NSJ-141]|uniref:ABC transporter ATP-binding protein n=1 Tax=Lientehia hominis TaxID=2897778 RepID=A0AAP2RI65_9FIRM|nr:ABC transporter ATP-binding protein [Lientehia hominis]MCD2491778.1 ABC transporter ATP-binding protein [Lientehia hominis]